MNSEILPNFVLREYKRNTSYISFPHFVLAISDQGTQKILQGFPDGELVEVPVGSDNNGTTPTFTRELIKLAHLISQEIAKAHSP